MPRIKTPGTRIAFETLGEWLTGAATIERRRPSSKRYRDADSHFDALPDSMIRLAERTDIERLIDLLSSSGNLAWSKPPRGKRGGTKWETANVLARNRHVELTRAEDLKSMIDGHNSIRR